MSPRTLIVADTVRAAARAGERSLTLPDARTIVTAEARSVAQDLGIALHEAPVADGQGATASAPQAPAPAAPHGASAPKPDGSRPGEQPGAWAAEGIEAKRVEQRVRQAIEQHTGQAANEGAVQQVLQRLRSTPQAASASAPAAERSGVRRLGQWPGSASPPAGAVGLSHTELGSLHPGTVRSVGFLSWNAQPLPFVREHDEVHLVLQGQPQYRHEGGQLSADSGDLVLIPRGHSVQLQASAAVRVLYLSYAE